MSWTKSLSRSLLSLCVLALIQTAPVLAHSAEDAAQMAGVKGGDFTLQSPGGPMSLSDLRGKVVLIFFGYTSCPDVCPLTLARINASFSALAAEELERVRALFITLDPERDTAERLKEYTSYFHANIIGLTGSVKDINTVTGLLGVKYERKTVSDSALGYVISHPTDILLLDHEGYFVRTVPHGADTSQLVSGIRGLLNAAE